MEHKVAYENVKDIEENITDVKMDTPVKENCTFFLVVSAINVICATCTTTLQPPNCIFSGASNWQAAV